MIRLIALLLTLGCGALQAEDLPAQFSVSGVAADDVLNIRQAPSAQAAKVGALGPYTLNIEVLALSENGLWGKIGIPEGNGWVSMRYLERQDVPDDIVIPRPLSCFGTEPFWRIGLYVRGDEFERLGEDRVDLERVEERPGESGYQADLSAEDGARYSLVVARAQCSDGMSDREFGWSGTLYIDRSDGSETLQGCCTLDHRPDG